jgi:branched-chain amino acid transport system ATP-binding protein
MLEVENLHAHYDKSHVLHGVNFTVGEGEIVSLLGRNGSGRSTTAKAIIRRLSHKKYRNHSYSK